MSLIRPFDLAAIFPQMKVKAQVSDQSVTSKFPTAKAEQRAAYARMK
jgi:hypothetical protein